MKGHLLCYQPPHDSVGLEVVSVMPSANHSALVRMLYLPKGSRPALQASICDPVVTQMMTEYLDVGSRDVQEGSL